MKALVPFCADCLAEMGRIMSAKSGGPGLVKKVAMSVALKEPVCVESTRFPRSKINVCGFFHREKYALISLV